MSGAHPFRAAPRRAQATRRLVVEWQDPRPTAAAGMSGLEYLRGLLAGELPPAPMGVLMGLVGREVEEGRVVFEGEPGEQHLNPIGTVHGGYAATLLDSALGCAVQTTLPAGVAYTTVELNVTYVGAITPDTGRVLCEAEVVHRGRTLSTSTGRLTRARDGRSARARQHDLPDPRGGLTPTRSAISSHFQ